MGIFGTLIEQIELFVIYIVIGVILVKTRVLNSDTLEVLSKYVMRLALPLLIFTNTINGVDRQTLLSFSYILLLTAALYLLLFFLAKALAKLFRLKGDREQVFRALAMFGNIGFMGIPIVTSIYPENGMLYISVFTIIDQLVLWTVGVKLTSPSGGEHGRFNPKKLINTCTVAIVLAVIFIAAGIHLPAVLDTALQKVGATATPVAMIYLGGVFACIDIRRYLKNGEFYGIVLVKMLCCALLVFLLLGRLPISQEVQMTLSLVTAMPAMSSVVMMAKASGSEGDYAMGGIFVTTICSIATLPLLAWVLERIMG